MPVIKHAGARVSGRGQKPKTARTSRHGPRDPHLNTASRQRARTPRTGAVAVAAAVASTGDRLGSRFGDFVRLSFRG